MDSIVLVFFAVLGLIFGSFGNVLILRIHSAESIGGRSHCPGCRTPIAWYDLIPVLSFLLLRARCRGCKKKISAQYPLVELGSMILFITGLHLAGGDIFLGSVIALALVFLFFACVYDALFQQIPDLFTALFFAFAALHSELGALPEMTTHFFGAGIVFLWFGVQWLLSKGKAVGTGDIFLGAAVGYWLGIRGAITMLLFSYMTGALVVALLLLLGRIKLKQQRISFGPFMGIATLLTLLGAGEVYLALLH